MVKKNNPYFLAIDLGSSGGIIMSGSFSGNKLELKEIDRFVIGMTNIYDNWYWNVYQFFENIKKGISKSVEQFGYPASGMAINTWGVDFGLLSENGELMGLPFAYRDPRTDGIFEKFFKIISKEDLYKLTGIQLMQINSIFQLYAMKIRNHPFLKMAKDLLFIPDILNYFFTGKKNTEFSFATTSQMYNPIQKKWEQKIFEKMEIPMNIMQDIIEPGTEIGVIKKSIGDETGASNLKVFAPVSHDTGSAVAAVPACEKNWAYISSGTWSLLGIETKSPIISPTASRLNFTNEGGVNSTFRVQKNLTGLWIIQKLKGSIKELELLDYSEIMKISAGCPEFTSFIDVDDHDFLNPANMESAVINYLSKTKQSVPDNPFGLVKVALESLAFKYRICFEQLEKILSFSIRNVHIIGGGSNNLVLNQYTANATGKKVFAGPGEATSIGNIAVQSIANGLVKTIKDARVIIKNSFSIKEYEPCDSKKWDKAFIRYKESLKLS